MNITILSQNKNALFSRNEVSCVVEFEASTPAKADLLKGLAKELKTKENHIVIRNIKNMFGQRKISVLAMVYDDPALIKHVESSAIALKHMPKEEAKQAREKRKAAKKARKAIKKKGVAKDWAASL